MMFAKYQYVLKDYEDEDGNVIETDTKNAEKFWMYSLQKISDAIDEEVSVYGIADESKYVSIDGLKDLKKEEVYISEPFAEKYHLKVGDEVSLDEKYEDKTYDFRIVGIYKKCESIAIFLSAENYAKVFDVEDGEFTGYLSNQKITDISQEDIATIISKKDITKMCDQLDTSMGEIYGYWQYMCVLLSVVLIYLLTKIIIEKNETAISMTKILGYENKEIAGLYLFSTTMVVVLWDAIGVVLGSVMMIKIWEAMMFSYSGWLKFVIDPAGYARMFFFMLAGYLVVMLLDFRRIKKIPMDEALKNVE
jgi:putative ABC transport system permease protein